MTMLDLDSVTGLSSREAGERLLAEGRNELPESNRRNVLWIIVEVFHEPIFLLLVASGLIYFMLGDLSEGLMLISFVVLIIAITVYQEQKTEHALEALRSLSSPRALVIRDGEQQRIPGREVVTRDLLILSEGDRVPADGILLSSGNLSVDESLLTGESIPVRKIPWCEGMQAGRPGGDDQPFVYSGTLVVQGQGLGRYRPPAFGLRWGRSGASSGPLSAVRPG